MLSEKNTIQVNAIGSRDASSKYQRFFVTTNSNAEIKRNTVRGGIITGSAQILKLFLRLGSTAILARLLTPQDYGLIAMAAVTTGFVGVFKDSGLTAATVQHDKITHQDVSTLFWINVALGGSIAALLLLISPLIAAFFREPRLTAITSVLALSFLMGGLTVQHQALLRRQMQFGALANIELISMIVGILTAILMAYGGMRHWSLVGMAIATAAANVIAVWLVVPWIPSLPRASSGVRSLVRFGSDVLTFNVVNFFSRQADNLLIGWFWGAQSLGFYDKAYNLLLLPISQINAPVNAVIVPGLARAKGDPIAFKIHFLGAFEIIASFTIPVIFFIAVFSEEVVLLWLGNQWMESAHLFRLLAGAALLGALSNPVGWVLVSSGHTRRYRLLGLLTAPVIVSAFAFGLAYGSRGVAIAYTTIMAILFLPVWFWALRGTGISLHELSSTMFPALIAGGLATIVSAILNSFLPAGEDPIMKAVPGAFGFGIVYLLVLLIAFARWERFTNLFRGLRASREAAAVQ